MTKDEIIARYKGGAKIENICIDYHASDKKKAKELGYPPCNVREARTKVYEVINEYWNREVANGMQTTKSL